MEHEFWVLGYPVWICASRWVYDTYFSNLVDKQDIPCGITAPLTFTGSANNDI